MLHVSLSQCAEATESIHEGHARYQPYFYLISTDDDYADSPRRRHAAILAERTHCIFNRPRARRVVYKLPQLSFDEG